MVHVSSTFFNLNTMIIKSENLITILTFQGTWRRSQNGNSSFYSNGNNGSLTPGFPDGTGSEWSLAMSPPPSDEAKYSIVRPKNLVERARMNVA